MPVTVPSRPGADRGRQLRPAPPSRAPGSRPGTTRPVAASAAASARCSARSTAPAASPAAGPPRRRATSRAIGRWVCGGVQTTTTSGRVGREQLPVVGEDRRRRPAPARPARPRSAVRRPGATSSQPPGACSGAIDPPVPAAVPVRPDRHPGRRPAAGRGRRRRSPARRAAVTGRPPASPRPPCRSQRGQPAGHQSARTSSSSASSAGKTSRQREQRVDRPGRGVPAGGQRGADPVGERVVQRQRGAVVGAARRRTASRPPRTSARPVRRPARRPAGRRWCAGPAAAASASRPSPPGGCGAGSPGWRTGPAPASPYADDRDPVRRGEAGAPRPRRPAGAARRSGRAGPAPRRSSRGRPARPGRPRPSARR